MIGASVTSEKSLEDYFAAFRENMIGNGQTFRSPFGEKQIIYADWTASGRAYAPIEEMMQKQVLPFVANTHTGATVTGTMMTKAYENAKSIIKKHVNAGSDDVLLFCGSGMTAAVNKLQRLMGLRMPERMNEYMHKGRSALEWDEELRPVVFVTHMEHHSNHISWLETIATVEIIRADAFGQIDLDHFKILLEHYRHKRNKIAAITACSNVTGIETPYHEIAGIIHNHGGLCFVDFACPAPYANIDMHPGKPGTHLDAIYFSPHKFLGGPGTPGVLILNKQLCQNTVPDQPGGGTVSYSNPWKVHEYITCTEQREDGGTPPILQGIRAAMCIRLKEAMGVANILQREKELLQLIFERLPAIKGVQILEGHIQNRLGVVSFTVEGAPYNLFVKLLNDRFGIQVRGGCSCAGTYGHYLLQVDKVQSYQILAAIRSGDFSAKPGWIRLSIHPTMTNAQINFILDSIKTTVSHFQQWRKDYSYNVVSNEFIFKGVEDVEDGCIEKWFDPANGKFSQP